MCLITQDEIRDNVVSYPHLLDWFFTQRVESFVKHWLYDILGATWHWYRYEFTVLRGAIHCHGLAKLDNDPNLCELGTKATKGYLAQKEMFTEKSTEQRTLQTIAVGKDAERQICDYFDYLVSCCNPVDGTQWEKPDLHPCRKSFTFALQNDIDLDYIDLVNSVQKHTKCNPGYCLRVDTDGEQKCRFGYPLELNEETYIKFNEITRKTGKEVRPEIVGKRNDSRVNRHQQIQLQGWRANCDIQLIIDHHAYIEYLAKYASKSEKMSSVARDAFVNVVNNISKISSSRSVIRKLMMKCVGERDMGIQEVMHQILSLKLYRSSFNVITFSLENSRKCSITNDEIITEKSCLEVYGNRGSYSTAVQQLNLIDFFSKYDV